MVGRDEDQIRKEFKLFLQVLEFPLYDPDDSIIDATQERDGTTVHFRSDYSEGGNNATYLELKLSGKEAHIIDIQRGTQYAGEGIGSELYTVAERFLAFKGVETITLNPDDGRREKYWKSQGFAPSPTDQTQWQKTIESTQKCSQRIYEAI